MAASPPPEPAVRARRPRIRTQLLAVLLPAVVLLLGLDSWHDYRDMSRAIASTIDGIPTHNPVGPNRNIAVPITTGPSEPLATAFVKEGALVAQLFRRHAPDRS